MPRETDRHTEVLRMLQGAVQHPDRTVVAERSLAIKRWLETYIENIKSFKDDRLRFLYNIFQDESCWSGTRLNNNVLGQRLTEEKIGEIDNPLRIYEIASSYCVVDKIHLLFQKRFESYKSNFSSGERDGSGNPITDKYIRNSLLSGIERKGYVFNFWIDRESGELKQPSNASEGFDSAVKLKWGEGVEYFYKEILKENQDMAKEKLIRAVIDLSQTQCIRKEVAILDFCVNNVADKGNLLHELLQKGKGVYFLVDALIRSCFFDTIHDLVQCWCYEGLPEREDHLDKIFLQRDYELFLYSLSNVMLENPELNVQARSCIMEIWRCDRLSEYRKAAVNTSNYVVPIAGMLAGLIVNWRREDIDKSDREKEIEKKEILDIMSFAKDCFPEKFESFKEIIIENLRLAGREGKKKNVDYGLFAKELFSELEKAPGPKGDGHQYNLRSQSQAHGSKKATLPLDGSGSHSQSTLKSSSTSGIYSQELPSELEEVSSPLDDSDPQSILGSSSVSGISSLHK